MIIYPDRQNSIILTDENNTPIIVPGILTEINVSGELETFNKDSYEKNISLNQTYPSQGYQIKKSINMTFRLIPTIMKNSYQQLQEINSLFTNTGSSSPKIFSVNNEHLLSYGIKKIKMIHMQSDNGYTINEILVRLSFEEELDEATKDTIDS